MRQPGLLLDRDGVINIDRGYVHTSDQFTFTPGLFPLLHQLQDRGFRLVIVTNQSGVARGLYTAADFDRLTEWMLQQFQRERIEISLVLGCFEHVEGNIAPYNRESFWRKPNPGIILDAAQRLKLDLSRSIMIGDHERDLQAAQAAGVKICFFFHPTRQTDLPGVINIQSFDALLSALPSGDLSTAT